MSNRASDQLRYLYGLNGLGDLGAFSFSPRAMSLVMSPSMVTQAIRDPQTRMFMQSMVTASGSPDPTNDQQTAAVVAQTCDCALAEIQRVFSLQPAELGTLRSACNNDPEGFLVALQQQAAAQGVTIDATNCGGGGPWHKDPKKLALAGAAGVAGIALLWWVMK